MFAIRPLGVLFILNFCAIQLVQAENALDLDSGIFTPIDKVYDKGVSPLTLSLGAGFTDNYNALLEPDLESSALLLQANGSLVSKNEARWLQANYSAGTSQFQLSDNEFEQEDSYNNLDFGVNSRFFVATRWSVDLNVRYSNVDERIGSGISKFRTGIAQNDSVSIGQGSVSLTYGADRSYRSIRLTLLKSDRDYDSNNPYSDFFDLEQDVAILYSNFRISDQTQLIGSVEYRASTLEQSPQLDSNHVQVLAGIQWVPSGSTKLLALIGGYQRRSDNRDTTSGVNWEVALEYSPRTDWLFNFSSKRQSTTGQNNELSFDTIDEQHSAKIIYFFSDQWQFGLTSTIRTLDYQELMQDVTSDEVSIGLSSQLSISDHNKVTLSLGSNDLEDQNRSVDYSQNSVSIAWQYEF